MFKVGDKGKTWGGWGYEVIKDDGSKYPFLVIHDLSDDCALWHHPAGEPCCNSIGTPDSYNLMPPDSYHYSTDAESGPDKEEVEMPEYLPEEIEATAEYEYDLLQLSFLEELAGLAFRYGIPVEYNIDAGVVTFNRTNSAT